ncbi:TetR family transcriptional regulator [soil metagenome]
MTVTPLAARATSPARRRILDAATERFYAEGIRAVSADRLIADAHISKVTFYRHFPTKDDLVVAYLSETSERERAIVASQRGLLAGNPGAVLRWYASMIGSISCMAGFRGCPFINAAAEYPDAAHPARRIVDEHRAWLTDQAIEVLTELGVESVGTKADQLMMLRDGAMIAGYVGRRPAEVEAAVVAGGKAIIRA